MEKINIHEKLQWAKEKHDLKDFEVVYEKSNKAVYCAMSPKWGSIVLKINRDKDELTAEYNMLKELNGENSCRVFEYEAAQGLLMEARITPGTVLKNEEDVEARANHFLIVFDNIHKAIGENHNFKSYLDWLKSAEEFCINNNVDEFVRNNMIKAYEIGEELFEKYSDRVLLHGDLHHYNMLMNSSGEYSMIDPKGVIGPAIFDLPRYILNEIDYATKNEWKEHILEVVRIISKKVNYPEGDILKLFFMEVMLANVWNIEDGEEPNLQEVSMALELLNL